VGRGLLRRRDFESMELLALALTLASALTLATAIGLALTFVSGTDRIPSIFLSSLH